MSKIVGVLGLMLLGIVVIGCMNKYAILQNTEIPNPPTEKVSVYIGDIEESRKHLNAQKQGQKTYKEEFEAALKQPELRVLQIAAGPADLENEKVEPNPFVLVEEKKDAQLLTYDDVYTTGRSGQSSFIHDTPEQRRAFVDLFMGMMVEKALF